MKKLGFSKFMIEYLSKNSNFEKIQILKERLSGIHTIETFGIFMLKTQLLWCLHYKIELFPKFVEEWII